MDLQHMGQWNFHVPAVPQKKQAYVHSDGRQATTTLQSPFLLKIAQLEEEENYAQIPVDLLASNNNNNNTKHSITTYRPQITSTSSSTSSNGLSKQESIRHKISRFILRPKARRSSESDTAANQQQKLHASGYEYTKWKFIKNSSVERSFSHEYLEANRQKRSDANSNGQPRNLQSIMLKSSSARTVRFRCPYDSSGSSSDQESTLVSPYITSSYQAPALGELSISSGYSSDFEPSGFNDHMATREDEIDHLLCGGPPPATNVTSSLLVSYRDSDIDIGNLDLSVFNESVFPKSSKSQPVYDAVPPLNDIDRIVQDVVKIKSERGNSLHRKQSSQSSLYKSNNNNHRTSKYHMLQAQTDLQGTYSLPNGTPSHWPYVRH